VASDKEAIYTDNLSKKMAARELIDKYKGPEPAAAEDTESSTESRNWDDADEEPSTEDNKEENTEQPPAEAPPAEEDKEAPTEAKEERPEITEEIKLKLEQAQATLDQVKRQKEERDSTKDKVDDLERQIKDKEDFLTIDFGPENAYYPLYGEVLKHKTIEYTYELDPFKSVKQEWTSLGDWEKWLDNGKRMRYDNGASCWGVSYKRNCEVIVQCGTENKISEVNEPNKCEYTMKLSTPAACSPAQLAVLDKEYQNLIREEADTHLGTKDIL